MFRDILIKQAGVLLSAPACLIISYYCSEQPTVLTPCSFTVGSEGRMLAALKQLGRNYFR